MYKTISYWTAPQPQDLEAFEEYYQQVHGPMAARVPGVQKLELCRASEGFADEPSPFYRVAEMYFHHRAAMERATETVEWAELGENAGLLIQRFQVTLKSGHGSVVKASLTPGGPRPTVTEKVQAIVDPRSTASVDHEVRHHAAQRLPRSTVRMLTALYDSLVQLLCRLPARLDRLVATSIGPPLAHRVPAMVMFPRADDGCQVGGYGVRDGRDISARWLLTCRGRQA